MFALFQSEKKKVLLVLGLALYALIGWIPIRMDRFDTTFLHHKCPWLEFMNVPVHTGL